MPSPLQRVLHDLETSHGLTATDRPDLPLTEATSWTLDFSKSIEIVKALMEAGK